MCSTWRFWTRFPDAQYGRSLRNITYDTTDCDYKKAFGTPRVLSIDGHPQLISPAAAATTAYHPQTGEELWRVYHGGMNVTAPPLAGLGKVFLCTGDGGLGLLAVRPDGHGDVTRTHIDWSTTRGVPSRSSPILVDDLLTMAHNDSGIVTCVEGKTGKTVWQGRLGGRYFASPIHAGGYLYFFDDSGTSHVIRAGRTWQKVAKNSLEEGCMASPAVAGKALFVRTRTHLYRIEEKP